MAFYWVTTCKSKNKRKKGVSFYLMFQFLALLSRTKEEIFQFGKWAENPSVLYWGLECNGGILKEVRFILIVWPVGKHITNVFLLFEWSRCQWWIFIGQLFCWDGLFSDFGTFYFLKWIFKVDWSCCSGSACGVEVGCPQYLF